MSMKMLGKLTLFSAVAEALIIPAAAMAHGGHHGGGHHGVEATTVIAIAIMAITVIAATTMVLGEDLAAMGMPALGVRQASRPDRFLQGLEPQRAKLGLVRAMGYPAVMKEAAN